MTDGLTFEQITESVTREVMEQYELLRKMGPCNMLDVNCVCNYAELLDLDALADAYTEHSALIWQNFGKLMKHYEINQDQSISLSCLQQVRGVE